MKAQEYIKKIEIQLSNWMTEIGFVNDKKDSFLFTKRQKLYIDHVGISIEKHGDCIVGYVQIYTRKIALIESYWEEYKETPLKITGGISKTFGDDFPKNFLFSEHNRPKSIANWANWREAAPDMVEKICEKVKSDYYDLVLPKLMEYSNIHKLDTIANGEDRTFSLGNSERYFRKLIIARLSGNPNYESIYEEMTGMYKKIILDEPTDGYYQNQLWVIEQLYEKLKNVQPLENPILI